jgi:hypothetical protein
MTGRRQRVSASSRKTPIKPATSRKRPPTPTSLSAVLPHQHNSRDTAQLKTDAELRLQAIKTYVDYEHASTVKLIDGQFTKLRKRWKVSISNDFAPLHRCANSTI